MSAALSAELAELVGEPVTSLRTVSGGDINDAYCARLASGRRLFVKTRADPPAGMYAREAEGLRWLAEADALRTPEVIAGSERCLVLSWIERGARRAEFEAELGRGIALLHQHGAPTFGLARDNFIGPLTQHNAALPRWSDFYRERRLMPLVARAHERRLIGADHLRAFERLYAKLDQLVGPDEPPARLHGDLWSGNVYTDEGGHPVLIDPSVYGGHREVDLAMLQLFGSPSPDLFAAYDEVHPRAHGHADRVALHQLYPLLVHVNLFGHGYVSQLREAVARYA